MGISCDSQSIKIAVAQKGKILDQLPERIRTPVGLEEHVRLVALLDEVEGAIDQIKPDRIVILPPEPTYEATHSELTPRIARETLVRMAAVRKSIPVEMLARNSVKSRLRLPRKGGLDSHLDAVVPQAVGRYWRDGRGLAAMAALAGESS